MGGIAEVFRTGGPFVYVILMFAILGTPLMVLNVILTFASKNRTLLLVMGSLSLLLIGLVGLSAVIGYTSGMSQLESALRMSTPENRMKLAARGTQIASQVLVFGGVVALIISPGLLALVKGLFVAKTVQLDS